jgi:hypothetical protein
MIFELRQGNDDQFSTSVALDDHTPLFKARRQATAEATDIFARG